jgi:predicted AlkP superfamily phosphohydrolase/phosphomutase
LDGFDPLIAESMLKEGELPNLARLRAQGGYSRLRTTYPAQTPVAWSTFATGTNPGGHGIFDFIRRNPKTYLPEPSFPRYEQKNIFLPPKIVNTRRGTSIWQILSQAGAHSTVLRFPCAYPPDKIRGRMLAGMGVFDLRGSPGKATFYSSSRNVNVGESESVLEVREEERDTIKTHLIGPQNPKTLDVLKFEINLHLHPTARKITLRSDGQPRELEIREGEWSDWLKVKFKAGLLQSLRGQVRFYLARMEPEFELYASPINFDADAPLFPISSPPEYAKELSAQIGTFYTTGMVEDHNGLNNGRFGEEAFLAQCDDALNERARMMTYELGRFDEGFFFCLFDTPDRVQHMFRRDGARVVEEHYRKCDEIIGAAMEYVDNETLLIALSDHGMNSFERGFNLNTWLYDQGLLVLKPGVAPGQEVGDLLRAVDWERTQAYALGLSGVYLNVKGREERGIVEPEKAASLQSAIARSLSGLGDPDRDSVAIRSVVTREQIYRGPYANESPDLLVNYAGGYRVSWATSLGGIPEKQFEDNVKKWSGDHLIDPALVPGVLFMNRAFRGEAASLADMAPTILEALGLPKGEAMEGGSLLQ